MLRFWAKFLGRRKNQLASKMLLKLNARGTSFEISLKTLNFAQKTEMFEKNGGFSDWNFSFFSAQVFMIMAKNNGKEEFAVNCQNKAYFWDVSTTREKLQLYGELQKQIWDHRQNNAFLRKIRHGYHVKFFSKLAIKVRKLAFSKISWVSHFG